MSGPENLRGIDYQVWCTVLLLLNAMSEDAGFVRAQVESLDDEGEDLALEFADGRRLEIQIKKLAEGYNWTPALLRPILRRFAALPATYECLFLSNGSASRDLGPLKDFLEGNQALTPELVATVCNDDLRETELQELFGRVRIRTRHFPSPDHGDPALGVRAEVHRTVSGGPFDLSGRISDIAAKLWAVVFEAGRAAAALSREDLVGRFANAGLRSTQKAWALYPRAGTFFPHEYHVSDAASILVKGGLALVIGIGGSGKSSLLAEAAVSASERGRRPCWITLNALVEPEDIVGTLGQYSHAVGFAEVQASILSAERANIVTSVASAISAFPLSIILDRLEAATPRTQAFVEGIASALSASTVVGALVLLGREIPLWWEDVTRERSYAVQVRLAGLPMPSAQSMLRDQGIGDTDEQRAALIARLGGHPQSLFLLKYARPDETGNLETVAVELAHDWLIRRVLQELPENEREALARLSIFTYPAPVAAAAAVLDPLGQHAIRALQRRQLIRLALNQLSVHDAVRSAAAELLPFSTGNACHRAAADCYFGEIVREFDAEESVTFAKSIPWAIHMQAAHQRGMQEQGKFALVLETDDDSLLALFAIDKMGFPFSLGDAELEQASDIVERLEAAGLIEENPANQGKEYLEAPMFTLVDFSFYDRLLITSLCSHRGLAASLGYMEDMRPNFAFGQQGLVCPWEHCIELSPLPQRSRAEWAKGLEDDKRRLADPLKHELTDQHIKVLTERIAEGIPDWVPEVADAELNARACFFFGHACPAGRAQADVCREQRHFEWADPPRVDGRSSASEP